MFHQSPVSARPHDIDPHRRLDLSEPFNQGSGDGAVAHISPALRASRHDQEIDGVGGLHLDAARHADLRTAHHGPVQHQRLTARLAQGLPVQSVKRGRADNVDL